MKKSYNYRIGDFVKVAAVIIKRYDEKLVVHYVSKPLYKPIVGQITGLKTVYEGKVTAGYRSSGFDDDYSEPAYFTPTKTLTFWLVRFGLKNKEHLVAEENLVLEEYVATYNELPNSFAVRQPWTEEAKAELRRFMKTEPRDKKGRWVK